MRFFSISAGLAAIATTFLIASPVQAQTAPARTGTATIYRSINAAELNQVLTGKGYTVVKENETDFAVTTESGFRFQVVLTACDVVGQPAGCLGVSLRATWGMEASDEPRLRPVVQNFNTEYRIGKALVLEDSVFVERYAIMDGGVTLDHIGNELTAFLVSADVLQRAMAGVLED